MSTALLPSAPSEVSSLQGRRKTEKQILAALGDHRRLNGDPEAVYFVLRGAGFPVSIGQRRLPRIAISSDAEPAVYIAVKKLGLRDEPHSRPPTIIVEPRRELSSAMPPLLERSSSALVAVTPFAPAEGIIDVASPSLADISSASPLEVPLPDEVSLARYTSTPPSNREVTPLQAPLVTEVATTSRAKSPGERQREWCIQMSTPKQMVSALGFQAALKFESLGATTEKKVKKPSGRLWIGGSTKLGSRPDADEVSNSMMFLQQSLHSLRDPDEQLQRCIVLAQPRERTAQIAQAAIMLRRSRSAGGRPTAAGAVAARDLRARQALLQARMQGDGGPHAAFEHADGASRVDDVDALSWQAKTYTSSKSLSGGLQPQRGLAGWQLSRGGLTE